MGHAGLVLLNSPEAPDILKRYKLGVGEFEADTQSLARDISDPEKRQTLLRWYLPSLNKLLVVETFKAVSDFCKSNGKSKEMKAEQWFEFARMIRNALSHTFRFEFNKHDKSLLPVSWKNRTITLSMDGSSLDLGFFGFPQGIELISDMAEFITTRV